MELLKDHKKQKIKNDSNSTSFEEDEMEVIKELQLALKPCLLRRTKDQVCLELPPKVVLLLHFTFFLLRFL
jgi:SNF2 family DNA or RNA helicase